MKKTCDNCAYERVIRSAAYCTLCTIGPSTEGERDNWVAADCLVVWYEYELPRPLPYRCKTCAKPVSLTWEAWPDHCDCDKTMTVTECPDGALMVVDEK